MSDKLHDVIMSDKLHDVCEINPSCLFLLSKRKALQPFQCNENRISFISSSDNFLKIKRGNANCDDMINRLSYTPCSRVYRISLSRVLVSTSTQF
jgi:hypothetical protein